MTPHLFSIVPVPVPPRVEVDPVAEIDQPPKPLREAEVEVWMLPAAFLAPQRAAFAASLSSEERARRDRLVRPADRVRYELFRGAVRRILAGHLGVEPAALRFEAEAGGKPVLAPPFREAGLDFNLSHGGDLLALACARHCPLGVDVEQMDRRTEVDALAARFFHPRECAALAGIPEAARRARFLRWWTAREAWLKAHGQGLQDDLAALDFSAWPDAPWLGLADEKGGRWLAWAFGESGAWAGALVAGAATGRVRWRPAGSCPPLHPHPPG